MTREVVATDSKGNPAVVAVDETPAERTQRQEQAYSKAAQRLVLTRSQADRLKRAR